MTEHDHANLAAYLLAWDEAGFSPPDAATLQWAHNRIDRGKDEPHRGDCTAESVTCPRCLAEEYLRMAAYVIAVLRKEEPV